MSAIILSLLVQLTFAQQDPPYPERAEELLQAGSPLVEDVSPDFPHFNGVSTLWYRCSANVIAFNDFKADDRGLVITNGHCVNRGRLEIGEGYYPAPGETLEDLEVSETFVVFTNALKPSQDRWAILEANRLVFATMTDVDLAVYQLKLTYRELSARGIEPAILSDKNLPNLKSTVTKVSGMWQFADQCQFSGIASEIKEGDWTWKGLFRMEYNENCIAMPGSSGSSVFSDQDVVGVFGTMSNSYHNPCDLGNPCEIEDGERKMRLRYSYVSPVAFLYKCRNSKRQIDLKAPHCPLNRKQ